MRLLQAGNSVRFTRKSSLQLRPAARELSRGWRRQCSFACSFILLMVASLISGRAIAGDVSNYTYDALGRLVQVSRTSTTAPSTTSAYTYDPASNRTNVTVTGAAASDPQPGQGATAGCTGGSRPGGGCNAPDGSDFNADGIDDILWRNDNGTVTDWLGQSDGSFVGNNAATSMVDTVWTVIGSGDFNGDGRDDIIWRHNTGVVTPWFGNAAGGFTGNNATYSVALSWKIVGIGDFNNDHISDLLWRSDTGAVTIWYGTAAGTFNAGTYVSRAVDATWHVRGVGDINGDGISDIIWLCDTGDFGDWLGQADGSFFENGTVSGQNVASTSHVAGVADLNGDGRSDVVWRNDSGQLTYWSGRTDGGFMTTGAPTYNVAVSWSVVGTGDYNGDGRADLLWRNSDGSLGDWLSLADGNFFIRDGSALVAVTNDWHVQKLVTY